MKKTEPESYWPGIGQACKDKQTLVLFLLGCSLVATPLLYHPDLLVEHGYTWVREPESDSWQVISTIESKPSEESIPDATTEFRQGWQHHQKIPPELALFFNQPLSLRTCRQEDLEMLPGIGPRVASAIIATRQKKRLLSGPDDLLDVPGIGPSLLQRILPLVSFE
jgi:competence protein ComEA